MELSIPPNDDAVSPSTGSYSFNEAYDARAVEDRSRNNNARTVGATQIHQKVTSKVTDPQPGKELLRLCHNYGNAATGTPKIEITTQLSGKFFVAEYPWARPSTGPPRPVELTCYRRNLFSVYGMVLIPQNFSPFIIKDGDRRKITELSAELHASESLHGRPVKIITIPARRASVTDTIVPDVDPGIIRLGADLGVDRFSSLATFAISWNRLQFRIATAKNSRQASSQQLFRLSVIVVALLEDLSTVTVSRASSTPIVVRGSSPGSFRPRKDCTTQSSPQPTGVEVRLPYSSIEDEQHLQPQFSVSPVRSDMWFKGQGIRDPNLNETRNGSMQAVDSPEQYYDIQHQSPLTDPMIDIDLTQPSGSLSAINQAQNQISGPFPLGDSVVKDAAENIIEDSTLTYEYYPLSIDDWTVPIEAVYRPHYIHQQEMESDRVQNNGKKRFYKR